MTKNMPFADHLRSREAVGVWIIDNKVWKIYSTKNQLASLLKALKAADFVALPVGDYAVIMGEVTDHRGDRPKTTQGFALITPRFTGRHFALKGGSTTMFSNTIASIKHDETLKRLTFQ